MHTSSIPQEALESLKALALDGADADVTSTMVKILADQGYVEMLDGQPVLTSAGQNILDVEEREQPFPPPAKAD
jgi:hypothetical protein